MNSWRNFKEGNWMQNVDVRDFIQKNYRPYYGDESFLSKPTLKTLKLWKKCLELIKEEIRNGGVLNVDTQNIMTITSHKAGYIDKELEVIVGLQTDEPLKRGIIPFGGIRMVKDALNAYNYKIDPHIEKIFTKYRKTHNSAVFSVYTDEMKKARKSGVITGLPDAYGRGRIIGDYRRVALYGVDKLIEEKKKDLEKLSNTMMTEEVIELREKIFEQITALQELVEMAREYDFDITKPAKNAREAVQWLYFAYLGAIKEQNGAAMSLGRVSTFLDIYIERDIAEGTLTEEDAQELIDQFIIKLRMARHLRTPEYNQLFAGDPLWITECIGGMGLDGRPLVTKTSFRFLNTLINLGPAPEPNITILWSSHLPDNFKKYCAKISILTSAVQYENDDLMRPIYGDDYGIACCVSAMRLGKEMQFFGARCNLPKALLLALNGGKDEITGDQIAPPIEPIKGEYLEFNEVMDKLEFTLDWLCRLYVNTMNIIHYMHDKYAYERLQMALHDTNVGRYMAFGIAGLSVFVDSLSAIKYAKVKPIRNSNGLIEDFEVYGDFPKYGNNDDRVDLIAIDIVEKFITNLKKYKTYKNAEHTLSILTITSNVVYGLKTGSTPDGRKKGEPFAPGANPMHGRDKNGALASLGSVAKLPYEFLRDGISYTFSVVPKALGKTQEEKVNNLIALIDGYFVQGGHHINVNVLERKTLLDAMKEPEKYPQLTIRVSGYAVNFIKLSPDQQREVIMRTFHETM